MKILSKLDEYISIVLLCLMTIVAFLQVLFRFVFNLPLDWTEELTRYILICLVYLSAALTIKENSAIRVEIIDLFVKGKAKKALDLIIDSVCGVFMFVVAYQNITTIKNALAVHQSSPAIGIPMAVLYSLECFLFVLIAVMFFYSGIKNCLCKKEDK